MRILPISNFNFIVQKREFANNQNNYLLNKHFIQPKDLFEKNNSNISFNGINSGHQFRKIIQRNTVHCIYCNRKLLDEEQLNKLISRGLFKSNIKDIISVTKPLYYESLHPAQKEIFNIIEKYACLNPNWNIKDVIKSSLPKAIKKLRHIQTPILEEISGYAKLLPNDLQNEFKRFMRIQRYRINGQAYISNFSANEFNYKIKSLSKTIQDDKIRSHINDIASCLTHPGFKDKTTEIPMSIIGTIFNVNLKFKKDSHNLPPHLSKSSDELLMIAMEKLKKMGEQLHREDIVQLCDDSIKQIKKIPVIVSFSNKTFRYGLMKILDKTDNIDLKEKFMRLSMKFPTSINDINSFIVKYQNATSDAICYKIFRPSIATIEHLHPKSLGGPSVIGNYALACEKCNNSRQHYSLKNILNNDDAKRNPQKYFEDIFGEVLRENLSINDYLSQIKIFQKESGIKINLNFLLS